MTRFATSTINTSRQLTNQEEGSKDPEQGDSSSKPTGGRRKTQIVNCYPCLQRQIRRKTKKCAAFGRTLILAGIVAASIHVLPAQDKVPLTNGQSAGANQPDRLEIEVMEIHRLSAVPNHIRRSGKFVLLLLNRTSDANAAFVLEPVASGGAQASQTAAVRWGGPGGWSSKRASSAIIDQSPGEFHLKSATTGHVLSTITVEQAQ